MTRMNRELLLLIPVATWLAGCGQGPAPARAPAAIPVALSTVTAANDSWPSLYEATGTVRAQTSVIIAARIPGYVREVKVRTGDHVREGQPLVTLDTPDLDVNSKHAEAAREEIRADLPAADSAIAAARANVELAQVTFNRMQELFRKKSISNQEFDEATARLRAAQAANDMARAKRAQLDFRLATAEQDVRSAGVTSGFAAVVAPFAGLVVARSVEPGSLATPGTPLMTLERDGAYRLEASVDESHWGAIRVGQPVSVTLDGAGQALAARLSEIVSAVDAASRAYTVKIDLPAAASLRSGMFGHAEFQLGTREVLTLPAAAVAARGQLQSVFVVDSGIARTRQITTGEKARDRVEVLSGLTQGEQVILPVPPGLSDGAAVEVRR